MTEPLFTAREVQVAIEAVIIAERIRTERLLREMRAPLEEAIRANRGSIGGKPHRPIEDIIREAHSCREDP